MTAEELAECLGALHWSARQLAEALGINEATVRKGWLSGDRPIPPPIEEWLRKLAPAVRAAHRKYPPPAPPPVEARGKGRPPGGNLFSKPAAED